MTGVRSLVAVLGDQLDLASSAFDGFDPERDRVFMAEVSAEGGHVWSHKARIAPFLAAVRRFREALLGLGRRVEYVELCESTLGAGLAKAVARLRPGRVAVEPGELRRPRPRPARPSPSLPTRRRARSSTSSPGASPPTRGASTASTGR